MCISSYVLILSLFSQGLLLSVSKSLQKVDDEDMLLTTLKLGKILRNGERTANKGGIPLLKHYKTEDSHALDEEDNRNTETGSRHDFLNHLMPINLGRKQLPYLAVNGAMAFPSDNEIKHIESIQERETEEKEDSAKFPIGRRDFDMLRCMLGRVYRPCWQV
ncbi:MCH protein, partial [Hemiprocne comata]|nr:MCH protein [Hemiprocne comata]